MIDVSPKRRFLQEPHGVTSQKTIFFIVTAKKTWTLTKWRINREDGELKWRGYPHLALVYELEGQQRAARPRRRWRVHSLHSKTGSLLATLGNVRVRNSVAFSPQANYTDWATDTGRRILLPTLVDRRVSRGQRVGSRMTFNLSFLDRSRYFSLT
jgi:hypothetical protein